MEEEIICAGFGGQGIMILGKLLAYIGMNTGYNVTWMPSYGAEVRGGTAHSMIKISDNNIASPRVISPDVAIVMNKLSYEKFNKKVKEGGILLVNSSLVEAKCERKKITSILIPATEMANKLGNKKVANMVMMGSFNKRRGIFKREEIFEGLRKIIPSHRQNLIPINKKAIKKGQEVVEG